MKNKTIIFGLLALTLLSFSCASNAYVPEGEEIPIEYKEITHPLYVRSISQEQIDEDCEMLKYYFYNGYAGYDEAAAQGFDIDKVIEKIKKDMKSKQKDNNGLYPLSDFRSAVLTNFSRDFNLPDQHISINGGHLKDTIKIFYSDIYFEKTDEGYFVKTSDNEKIPVGSLYTGKEEFLYPTKDSEGTTLYRYGLLTKARIKSANISVDNQTVLISVKDDEAITQKNAWNGLKETEDTVYLSLSDCFDVAGKSDIAKYTEAIFREYLGKVSLAAQNKKNIIFDLRSNTGGYSEFPARILSAAYYNQHPEQEYQNNIWALMENRLRIDNQILISPLYLQIMYPTFENEWKDNFALLSDKDQTMFKHYYKKMTYKPVRVMLPAETYKTNLEEFPAPDFQGNVYILTNCYTASAAELGTAMAFLLKNKGINVQIVGENSCGAVKYVGMLSYSLPNSGINMRIGSRVGLAPIFSEIPQFMGEGAGFYPDYWATNSTILQTLVNVTGDEKLTEVLAGLDKNML